LRLAGLRKNGDAPGIDFQGEHDLLDGLFNAGRADSEATTSESFVPLTIVVQSRLRINTLGGNDLIILDDPRYADALTSFVIDGGDGTDRVLQAHLPPGFGPTLANVEMTAASQVNQPGSGLVPGNVETTATDPVSDEVFVRELYHGSLRRDPSPAEVDDWLGVLHGPLGRAGVVAGIDQSSEAHARLVRGWYEHYLGRTPAAAEIEFWQKPLDRGAAEESILAKILGSPEFDQHAGGQSAASPNGSFVRGLYQELLARAGGDGEVGYWLSPPAAQDHAQIAADFLTSPELRGRFVEAAYRNFLERVYDTSGRQYWVDSGLGFADMRRAFLLSNDFFNDSHTDPFGSSGSFDFTEGPAQLGPLGPSQFDASGHAEFTGTSSQDEDVFTWTLYSAPRTGTIAVHVSAANTPAALLRVTFNSSLLLETQPWSQINSGEIDVAPGQSYLFSLRSPFNTPSDFVVDLDYLP
jgi:hypothetical protein